MHGVQHQNDGLMRRGERSTDGTGWMGTRVGVSLFFFGYDSFVDAERYVAILVPVVALFCNYGIK